MAARTALVLYGSETGNAQDMAEQLGEMLTRLHFQNAVEEMDAVDLNSLLSHQLVVFVVSTTGQGDMPHNSLLFWKRLLRRKLPPGCLGSMRYTSFGLGDSTYLKFNWAARKLVRRLDQLGASTFLDPFEADEQFPDGVDGSFVRWADRLRNHIIETYPSEKDPIPDRLMLPARWSLEPALSQPITNLSPAPSLELGDSPPTDLLPLPNGLTATLSSNKRMTPTSHWQDVRHIRFSIPSRDGVNRLQVHPGDCLTIYPKNFPQDAQKLITLMGWDAVADAPLDLSKCASLPRNLHSASNTTIRSLLLNNIDINAIPRRSFLKSMSYFSTDADHKDRLLEFTMTDYIDEYFDYATRSRRTIIEVLEEFTSVQIPADRILDIFPLIRGRDFSIANGGSHLAHPSDPSIAQVELLVALVKYKTVLRKPREGLCSRYFDHLDVGAQLSVTHKSVLSPIHGAANAQRPLIAMATGTGLAPVRCLIQERMTHPSPGPVMLFFGNRNRSADYFFGDEWKTDPENFSVFLAFSRDQREKIYVQDLIRRESKAIASRMSSNPIFAICGGSSKMADACKAAVFDPFIESKDGQQAKDAAQLILDNVTWWQEIW